MLNVNPLVIVVVILGIIFVFVPIAAWPLVIPFELIVLFAFWAEAKVFAEAMKAKPFLASKTYAKVATNLRDFTVAYGTVTHPQPF